MAVCALTEATHTAQYTPARRLKVWTIAPLAIFAAH